LHPVLPVFFGFNNVAAYIILVFGEALIIIWIQSNANLVNRITKQSRLPSPIIKKDLLLVFLGIFIIFGLVVDQTDNESIYSECMTQMSSSEFSVKDQQSFCKCTQTQFNQYPDADPEKVMNYCLFDLPSS